MTLGGWLFGLVLLCYCAASICYHLHLFTGSQPARRLAPVFLGLGVAAHAAALGQPWFEPQAPPMGVVSRTATTIAWTLAVTQLVLDWKQGWAASGSLAVPLAFVLVFYANVLPRGHLSGDPALRSPLMRPHLVATILGFVGLALSFSMAVLYLAQSWLLKRKLLREALDRLPPLETTARAAHWLAVVGFSMLTLGIVTGAIVAAQQEPAWFLTARVLTSLLAWLVYAIYLAASTVGGWRGRRTTYFLIGGFAVLMVAYVANLR